jgi:hypothetical protein
VIAARRPAATLLAAALLASTCFGATPLHAWPASLIPPGWNAKRPSADPARLKMPAALKGGSRAALIQPPPLLPTRVTISPSPARLGQRVTYRASILVPSGQRVRFDRPASGGEFSWGDPHTGSRGSMSSSRFGSQFYLLVDSLWMEVPLQVFATGPVVIPGPAIEFVSAPGTDGRPTRVVGRLPTAHLLVLPTITAADTNAQLRALHGPIGAPWWERVQLKWVVAGVLVLAAVVALVLWLRRRRRVAVVAPVTPRPVVARDPAAEALAELRALRALRLPEEGRFADHAFALTRILRRYLEAVVGTPRPGDTSGELVARLRLSRLAPEDVSRLEGLLGLWDRVKFARAPLGFDEAIRCESAVETLVRRRDAQEVA